MKRTIAILAFFVAAVLAGLFVQSSLDSSSPATKEKFMQQEKGMPVSTTSTPSGFGMTGPILGSSYQPVLEEPYETADDTRLYLFQDNKMSADCCPSSISGDLGCVCLTDKQRTEFASRGGNRAA